MTASNMSAHGFMHLARTHAASLAGDVFVTVALAGSLFFAVPLDAARPNVALYLLITMAPFAVVAPLLGPALDRASRYRVVMAAGSCWVRALLALLLARHLGGLLLYPEAFGVLVAIKGYLVAKSALVPAVVPDEAGLVRANSRLALVGVVGGLAGAVVAVPLLRYAGASWVLVVGALVYLGAGLLALRVPGGGALESGFVAAETPARVRGIRLAAIAMGVLRCAVGFLTFLLAFALRRADEPAWFYGAVIAVSAAGGFFGAVVAPRLRKTVREEALLVASLALPAAVAVLGARSNARPQALMVAFALGLGAAAGRAGFDSLVQRDAPHTVWGRSFARYEGYFQLAWVLGAFVPVVIVLLPGTGLMLLALGLGAGGFLYLGALAAESLFGAHPP